MNFELIPLRKGQIADFKREMQEAFQHGAEEGFEGEKEEVLPESHIDHSLAAKGSVAYEALVDGERAGGAIVVINTETQHHRLDFLYVKAGAQGRGVGSAIWQSIEQLYPQTVVWETCTPYFEKRNLHFYINRCGFHAVEFYNKYHPDPNGPGREENSSEDEYFEEMFRFEKRMREDKRDGKS